MKIVYESVRTQLDRLIAEARKNNRRIIRAEMTKAELDELYREIHPAITLYQADSEERMYMGVHIKVTA